MLTYAEEVRTLLVVASVRCAVCATRKLARPHARVATCPRSAEVQLCQPAWQRLTVSQLPWQGCCPLNLCRVSKQ